jgi:acetyltransferase-like isoleucine patch superfamily enzyme
VLRGANRLGEITQLLRVLKYRALSTCERVSGTPVAVQPVLMLGPGSISLGENVEFGWRRSRAYRTGYCHLEAAAERASIEIGADVQINNDVFIKSEGPGIRIGARALLGSEVTIYDSDFHELHPARRRGGEPGMARVELGENVFVGDRVTILKGVTIGADAVIGAGSVVTRSIPAGVIAAGNPARVIGSVPADGERDWTVLTFPVEGMTTS